MRLIEESLQYIGKGIEPSMKVLDFGCGCGRTLRPLLPRYRSAEFQGVDVDAASIEWCLRNLAPGQFQVTSPVPPLPFPAQHFDVIYAISVFTHLDEAMQDAWISELTRILKKTGVLLFTVHGKLAARALDQDARETLQRLGFLHRRSAKLKSLVPEWYCTTWHAENYIIARLSCHFENIKYRIISDGIQDVVLAWDKRSQTDADSSRFGNCELGDTNGLQR